MRNTKQSLRLLIQQQSRGRSHKNERKILKIYEYKDADKIQRCFAGIFIFVAHVVIQYISVIFSIYSCTFIMYNIFIITLCGYVRLRDYTISILSRTLTADNTDIILIEGQMRLRTFFKYGFFDNNAICNAICNIICNTI